VVVTLNGELGEMAAVGSALAVIEIDGEGSPEPRPVGECSLCKQQQANAECGFSHAPLELQSRS